MPLPALGLPVGCVSGENPCVLLFFPLATRFHSSCSLLKTLSTLEASLIPQPRDGVSSFRFPYLSLKLLLLPRTHVRISKCLLDVLTSNPANQTLREFHSLQTSFLSFLKIIVNGLSRYLLNQTNCT